MTKTTTQKVHIFNVPAMRMRFNADRAAGNFSPEYAISPNAATFYDFKKFNSVVKKAAKLDLVMPFDAVPEYPVHEEGALHVFSFSNIRVGYSFATRANTSSDLIVLTKDMVRFVDEKSQTMNFNGENGRTNTIEVYSQEIIKEILEGKPVYYFFSYNMPHVCTTVEAELLMDHYSKVLDFYEKGEQYLELQAQISALDEAKRQKVENFKNAIHFWKTTDTVKIEGIISQAPNNGHKAEFIDASIQYYAHDQGDLIVWDGAEWLKTEIKKEIKMILLGDLEQLIKSHKIVHSFGGLKDSKAVITMGKYYKYLKKAVADVEACQH